MSDDWGNKFFDSLEAAKADAQGRNASELTGIVSRRIPHNPRTGEQR